jgi:hypothetical protein
MSAALRNPVHAAAALPPGAASAAHAVYRQLCAALRRDCRWLELEDFRESPLSVQWEVRKDSECAIKWIQAPSLFLRTLARYLGFGVAPETAKTECLPMHQIALSELFASGPEKRSLKPPHLGPDEPYVVLAGVTMPSLNDYHLTPLYEKIAGVYLHAAAIENLYRMQDDYVRQHDLRLYSTIFWLLLVVLADRVAPRLAGGRTRARSARRALLSRCLYLLLIAVVVVLVYAVLYGVFDIAPEGWLFMVGLLPLLLSRPRPGASAKPPPTGSPHA